MAWAGTGARAEGGEAAEGKGMAPSAAFAAVAVAADLPEVWAGRVMVGEAGRSEVARAEEQMAQEAAHLAVVMAEEKGVAMVVATGAGMGVEGEA